MKNTITAAITAFSLLLLTSTTLAGEIDTEWITKLQAAPTKLEQNKIITENKGWIYDFNQPSAETFNPGSVRKATVGSWSSLYGLGMAVQQLNLGPCAMLTPHLHRNTNLVVAVNGTTHTYMIQENGADMVETYLSPGMMTIFPAASIHTMVNEGCGDNVLYSFLNGEDPGTLQIINAFMQFGPEIGGRVLPVLNDTSTSQWGVYASQVPIIGTGTTSGYESCLQKCGLA